MGLALTNSGLLSWLLLGRLFTCRLSWTSWFHRLCIYPV